MILRNSSQLTRLEILKILVPWMAYWSAVIGTLMYVIKPQGIDQFHNNSITASYFIAFTLASIWIFKIYRPLTLHQVWSKQLAASLLTAMIYFTLCYLVSNGIPLRPEVEERILVSRFYFPLFTFGTAATKFVDVLFQQVTIYGLLRRLQLSGLQRNPTIFVFSTAFLLLHLPLFHSLGFTAVYLVLPSALAGWIFSSLILNYELGPSLALGVHLIFYVTIGAYLRL